MLFYSTSLGIKAIFAIYPSILIFYVYMGLMLKYYLLLSFEWINRVTGLGIFTNNDGDIIQGIGLTVFS